MKSSLLEKNSALFSILEDSVEGSYIFMCDMGIGYSRWSKSAVEYFNLPGCYMYDTPSIWGNCIHPEDRHIFFDDFNRILSGESDQHECEYRAMNRFGVYVWLNCKGTVIRDEKGDPVLFAGAITNLGHIGKYDATTNLKNIYEFRADLSRWIQDGARNVGILMMDINSFSRINERYSYSFGNRVLRNFGRQIRDNCEGKATIYRMDGDKFVCFYPGAGKEELKECFDQFQYIAGNTVRMDGKDIRFSLSGGAVLYPNHGEDVEEIHRNLEYALQWAKKERKMTLTMFAEDILYKSMRELEMTEELNKCVYNHCEGFFLCYQPIVDTSSGGLYSCEALLRWKNREGQIVSPMEFIPILESNGEICRVGNWILETALGQLSEWHKILPQLKINVNVSYLQFHRPEFKDFVMAQLERFDIAPECLVLELTETCKIMDMEELRAEFDYFRERGVKVALDDFGTGYASVSVLKDLPIDWVKIDHGFVSQLMKNQTDRHIIEYLINLCRKLDIIVCVEGIETDSIRNLVGSYMPDSMQGYYFSRPVVPETFYERFVQQ